MIKCAKLNGNGNDFLAINNMDLRYSTKQLQELALKLCRRKECIGGDGILVTEPSTSCDFKMRIFNSDGSEGEMCGNGARCLACFALENRVAEKADMVFETLAGPVRASVKGNMAQLDLPPVDIGGAPIDQPVTADGFDCNYTFLTVGVPHAVVFLPVRDRSDEEYRRIGSALRYMPELFPEGTNVDFVFPGEKAEELFALTYERGVEDLTLSCGTGSVASVIAAYISGRTGTAVDVRNPGGLNRVTFDFVSDKIILPKLEGAVMYVADLLLREEALK